MEQLIQQLINGISIGSIYALIALGYTMVYGIIKLINFAHGDILMIGAFSGYYCAILFDLPLLPAIMISMVICSLLGVSIEKVAYRPLRSAPRITLLITAIGVSFLLEYIMMYFFKADARSYPPGFFIQGQIFLGNIRIPKDQLFVTLLTITLMVLLQLIVRKTRMGRAMRAVSSDRDAAMLMGVSVDKTISFTFLLGSALAGAAGVMYGAMFKISPLMGMQPGIKAFVAAVFGGIGSVPGAMLGGLLLGLIETLVSAYISSSFKDAAAFAILIVILLVRPNGLLGKNTGEKV
ncbi:MAG: branched-chain amino acid ABC transporter permease [Anaerovoracaceae bacterium]|jgi:branched-chain amino acid transport system permease protein